MKFLKKISLMILTIAFVTMSAASFTACNNDPKQLGTPKNIVFDITTQKVTFDKVENADRYFVDVFRVVPDGADIKIATGNANTNEMTFTETLPTWQDYYAEVYATSLNSAYQTSESAKSAVVRNNVLASPMFRVVKSIRESATQTGPGGTNTVKIQLNPAQFKDVYTDVQAVPASFEFKVYSGTAATGTPLLTKTVTGTSLSVTGTTGAFTATGFTFDITSALTALGNFRMTLQAIAGTTGTTSALYEYTYNYTAHGTSVTNTNAGTYTAVTGYTFVN